MVKHEVLIPALHLYFILSWFPCFLVHPIWLHPGSVLAKNLQCHIIHSHIFLCDLVIMTLLFCKWCPSFVYVSTKKRLPTPAVAFWGILHAAVTMENTIAGEETVHKLALLLQIFLGGSYILLFAFGKGRHSWCMISELLSSSLGYDFEFVAHFWVANKKHSD